MVVGRIVIEDIRPAVDSGRWPARAAIDEPFVVEATIFRDGRDLLAAAVIASSPAGRSGEPAPMTLVAPGTDRWAAEIVLDATGDWTFVVEAWSDPVRTWQQAATKKLTAGLDIALELEEGARLLDAAARGLPRHAKDVLRDAAAALRAQAPQHVRLRAGLDPVVGDLLARHPYKQLATRSKPQRVRVERARALVGAWYEFFPRSVGATATSSGTLKQAAERLPEIAAMGFDVAYLPPIHPIGRTHRKGRNNTPAAGPDDPGSPWAIGGDEGGHTAVHPELGTLEDFDEFLGAARDAGLEVAMDYALQCSPDHPWLREHPDWFNVRPDGSIACAENPPKVYQDIVPLNFDTRERAALYAACKDVLDFWILRGVRMFRVDNPHTKPVRFWAWLIAAVKAEHPDVVLLAEAFTRPPMLHMLAKVGFTQSYTYFTWRNTKAELEEYLEEIAHGPAADYMRPNFFVNTPDILHEYLQTGGLPAFKTRAVLAATSSPSWGVYSGYELLERTPVHTGSEEYLDSEKYQYRPRDYAHAPLAPYLTRLNEIRATHPALRQLRNLRLHLVDNPNVLAYSKRAGDDVVLVVVNVDPFAAHDSMLHLWMPLLGLDWDADYDVVDELTGGRWRWHGGTNYVRLDPGVEPAHILRVTPA